MSVDFRDQARLRAVKDIMPKLELVEQTTAGEAWPGPRRYEARPIAKLPNSSVEFQSSKHVKNAQPGPLLGRPTTSRHQSTTCSQCLLLAAMTGSGV